MTLMCPSCVSILSCMRRAWAHMRARGEPDLLLETIVWCVSLLRVDWCGLWCYTPTILGLLRFFVVRSRVFQGISICLVFEGVLWP